jgi:uncharacterized repeat protein (TIGR02543 family)
MKKVCNLLLIFCAILILGCGATEEKPLGPPQGGTTHTVTFDFKYGSTTIDKPINAFESGVRSIENGAEIRTVLPANPKRPRYTFVGWSLDKDGLSGILPNNYRVNGDIKLYAQWRVSPYLTEKEDVNLGMFYFGMWSDRYDDLYHTNFHSWFYIENWSKKNPSLNREPLLGWYNDYETNVLEQQVEWIANYGIDFVTFTWFWDRDNKVQNDQAIQAYLRASNRGRVDYSLLWVNHYPFISPVSLSEWNEMVDNWIENHFRNPEYLYIDGKPVIFIFSPSDIFITLEDGSKEADGLAAQAKALNLSSAELLNIARERAKSKGFEGIYFVLCDSPQVYWAKHFAEAAGVDATTTYNYHQNGNYVVGSNDGVSAAKNNISLSYAELAEGYQNQWEWRLGGSVRQDLTYFVPMTAGWNKGPWFDPKKDGPEDLAHSNSYPLDSESFEAHLREGYSAIINNRERTRGFGMLNNWNEYGEGTIIEPTKRLGFGYLQRIQEVFRTPE